MEIVNYLPNYPLIDEDEEKIPFNEAIFRKKEFYDLRARDKRTMKTDDDRIYLDHQEIINRFMSPYTLYDEMLLYHSMGSGKTFSAIGLAERVLDTPDSPFKKVLLILPNLDSVDNFIHSIVNLATQGKYAAKIDPDELTAMRPKDKERKIRAQERKNVFVNYYIDRFRTFYKNHSMMSDAQLRKKYSNHVIVFDEAHNVLNRTEYNFYHRFFHAIDNRKILLMTGTPMVDDVADFGKIMNLILPLSQQFPTDRNSFNSEFIDGEFLTQEGSKRIAEVAKGRISFLRSLQSNTTAIYEGQLMEGLRYIRVFPSIMSPFQNEVYGPIYEKERGGWKRDAQQASLFAFPNGQVGSDAFKIYVKKIAEHRYVATKEWRNLFRNLNTQQKLERLRTYSCKYAKIIEILLNTPRNKAFIFNESIEEGGVLMLAECMKLFGFSQVTSGFGLGYTSPDEFKRIESNAAQGIVYNPPSSNTAPSPKFAVLSDKVISSKDKFRRIIRTFNDVRNQHGQYIQVIIGGKQVSEGYTFKDITQIHVATPHWNFSVTSQAIARAIRFKSHRDPNTEVNIYLHVAIPTDDTPSIDIEMYKKNETKDILIKRLTRVVEKACFDCALNYKRNLITDGVDNSPECFYEPCEYKCDDVQFPYERTEDQLDRTTYNLYYSERIDSFQTLTTTGVYQELVKIFKSQFSIPITDFIRRFSKYDIYTIVKILKFIIQNHISFENKYGLKNYIHIQDDQIFLTNEIFLRQNMTDTVYSEFPIVNDNQSFESLLENTTSRRVIRKASLICEMPVSEQIREILSFPRNIQEIYLEQSASIFIQQRENSPPLVLKIMDALGNYIHFVNDNLYSSLLLQTENKIRQLRGDTWEDASQSVEKDILDSMNLIQNNPVGYYIRYNALTKTSNIVALTGNASDYSLTGINCMSKTVNQLNVLIRDVMDESPVDDNKGELCEQITEWFMENNLVFYL